MGHKGSGHAVSGNRTGSIGGTNWGFEQWAQGGNNSMTYYDNGTFKASWNNSGDYLARVGFRYGDNGSGVDHKTKHYAVDYKYTNQGSASYGYIGVYGWTVNPQTEYYIVDDWYSKPNEAYIGPKFGEIEVDGAKYTIHAFLRDNEPSKTGNSTFVQFFSVRETPRKCGHIDISAHFNKWDELFHGQTATLPTSKKGKKNATLKFGRVTEVMLMNEAGGSATGSIDYTYFNMVDNATSTVTPKSSSSVAPPVPSSSSEEKTASSSSHHHHHGWGSSSSTESLLTVAPGPRLMTGSFQVFDMQGRMMGMVDLNGSVDLEQVLKARFQRLGVYLVKQGAKLYKVQVKY